MHLIKSFPEQTSNMTPSMQTTTRDLEKAVSDCLLWMISSGYSHGTFKHYEWGLNHFLSFVKQNRITWDNIFTLATLKKFQNEIKHPSASYAIRALSKYLFQQKRISSMPTQKKERSLPEIYEEYLVYSKKNRQYTDRRIKQIKRVLTAFYDHLVKKEICLPDITIEQIDMFLVEFNTGFAQKTCSAYRYVLRGFLSYLYRERKIIKRDFSPLVVGAPVFEQTKPPMFLRPHEIQRLFDNTDLSTPAGLRTYAILQLAYTLGLRLKEICRITLNDIEFGNGKISINDRKSANPIKLPLPEDAIKAIAAYIIGARPESRHKTLFLTLCAPYSPISPNAAHFHLKNLMLKADLPSTAHWLRHTYAQNLLEAGASICEIKEMMGHESIRSTQNYLRIHIKLMQEVLFDE